MSDEIISTQLLLTISEESLYPKLIKQLNKDFYLAGIEDEFPLNTNHERLLDCLNTIIYDLINHRFSEYLNLLYRVDISEQRLKKIDGSNLKQMSNKVSVLILKRECQKILIRNKL